MLYNHANFYRFEETSSYWPVKCISIFLCFSLVNKPHTSGITVYNRIVTNIENKKKKISGEPGLVDRALALHAGSRGFDSHRGHMSERFFRSNRPEYPHPVSSELENSGIRVAVGDCSVTERRRWRPPYQTGKTVHVHAKHYKHNEDGHTAPGVCGNGSVPLSHSGNVVTRIGIHTHTHILKTMCGPCIAAIAGSL